MIRKHIKSPDPVIDQISPREQGVRSMTLFWPLKFLMSQCVYYQGMKLYTVGQKPGGPWRRMGCFNQKSEVLAFILKATRVDEPEAPQTYIICVCEKETSRSQGSRALECLKEPYF